MKRVVITGMGAITPVGNNVDSFWDSLKNGKSGVTRVTRFDPEPFKCQIAAEVKDFDPAEYIDKKEARRMDRFTQFAVVAADEAIKNSGLDLEKEDLWRIGVITGSGVGGMETIEDQHQSLMEKGGGRVSPFFVPMMISNIAPAQIAIKYRLKGANFNVVSACASGTNALGEAFKKIQDGSCDVILAGGCEAAIIPLSFAGFCNMKAMSTRNDEPEKASRPFDNDRDGFVMGEGAGILVLEEYEHAKSRGANIICEFAGYGATDDAYHITSPIPGGLGGAKAMEFAIKDAGIDASDITYINAHGTSTKYNDSFETEAIKSVLGDSAKDVYVSSTKSVTGHLLGAAGAIEAIACAKSISEGFIPPTINYTTPDPECDLNYVPNVGIKKDVKYAMSNSLGFGGHNATIIFKKYE